MLEQMTSADWQPHLDTEFRVALDVEHGGPLRWTLEAVQPWGQGGVGRRQPFTLWFIGPPAPVLPQAIRPLEHPELGRVELFLVPIGPDGRGGMRYEAVFT